MKKPLKELRAQSGVKDKIAEHWIPILLAKSLTLKTQRIRNVTTRDPRLNNRLLEGPELELVKQDIMRGIQQELMDWLYTQPFHSYSALPISSRMFYLNSEMIL